MNRAPMKKIRNVALAGASAVAMMAVFAGSAGAQSSAYDLDMAGLFLLGTNASVVQTDYNLIVTFDQLVDAPSVTAIITGATSVLNVLSGDGFPAVTSNNSLTATAKGTFVGAGSVLDQDGNPVSIADRVVDLSLLSSSGDNDGIGVLASQLTVGSTVTAEITAGAHLLSIEGFQTGTADVSGNRAVAMTTINEISPDATVRGNLPVAYSSTGTASATGNFDGNLDLVEIDATATVAITSVQFGLNSGAGEGSLASVTDRDIALSIYEDDAGLSVTASLSVTNNAVQAQYTGNQARNVFLAEGGNPNFTGSVVVSNNQANIETTAPGATDYTAIASGNAITATVGDQVLDDPLVTTLQSMLNVSGNLIAADSRGNVAQSVGASGQPVVGNAIVFAPGINVVGNADIGSNLLNIPTSDVLINEQTGDLVLFNGQGNQGTSVASQADDNSILATVEEIVGGGINLSSNTVRSSATGNTAIGLIQVGGAAVFDAIVASGNLQTNDATPINAENNGTQIIAKAGEAVTLTAPSQIVDGTITVNNNAVTATATGSSSGTASLPTISITASTLNSTGGLAEVTSDTVEYGALTTSAGITASNLQHNYGEEIGITATVSGGNIQAQLYNNNSVNLLDGTLTLNGNSFASSASGNVAFTGIELSGSQGAFSAAASSSQYNINSVGASTENNTVFTFMDDLLNSTGTLNSNQFRATAVGNSSSTSVEVSGFSDLTLGDTVANTWANPSVVTPVLETLGVDNTATGALVSLNNQANYGDVVGTVSNAGSPFVSMFVNDLRDDATASISSNRIAASAIGNQASTSLTLSVENLQTGSGSADQIATLSSRQTDEADAVTSSVTQTGAVGAIGLVASGDIIDSVASVNSNRLTSFTAGNFAENSLTFEGTSYASTAVAGSAARMTFLNGGLDFETGAEFSLQNLQQAFSGDSLYSASVVGGVVGIGLTGTVLGDVVLNSVLTVSGNASEADARGNYGVSTLDLTGFSNLATSAALHNIQGVVGDVSATVLEAEVGIEGDTYNVIDSVLTVTGNSATARAIGNTGINSLLVEAESLGGSGGIGSIDKPAGLGLNAASVVSADYALSSWQGHHNDVSASTSGMALIDLSSFTGDSVIDSTITVSNNSLTAVAQNNSVSNLVSLSTTSSTSLTAVLLSEQRAGSGNPANATATAGVTSDFATAVVTADNVSGTPIAVSGNSVTAIAGNNEATNRLVVEVGANLNGQASTAANATLATGTNQVLADFAVMNIQDAAGGAVSATATPGVVGAIVNETVASSPISVTGNNATAQSTINSALNTLSLTGASALNATAGLVNSQTTNGGSASATVQFGVVGAIVFDGATASPLNVSGNSYVATAAGNTATNALNATSSSVYSPSGSPAIGGAITGGLSAQADYAVLNVQSNTATISATAQALAVGVLSGGPVTNSNMSVTGNIVSASATGNRAVNSIGMSAVAGGLPSASLTSAQVNSASVSANVTGVVIGIGAGGVAGSSAVVSGNSISATAIGNSARGTIGIGN